MISTTGTKIYKKMKINYIINSLFIVVFSLAMHVCTAQQMPLPARDTPYMPNNPKPLQYNAGFDVIILINGDIVYGLVKEVDETFVKYQRTDIPDGPVYTIRKNSIYAISYRNQVKEYFSQVTVTPRMRLDKITIDTANMDVTINDSMYLLPPLQKSRNFRIGLGFIRGFSKVDNVGDYNSKSTFPILSLAYDVEVKTNVRTGVLLAFGTRKYDSQTFNSYDSTSISSDISEKIFSLMVYGKYGFGNQFAKLHPYVQGGIGINSGRISAKNQVSFTNNNPQVLQVKSGGSATSLGILARIGADYTINKQFGAFADLGSGSALLQVGAIFKIQ